MTDEDRVGRIAWLCVGVSTAFCVVSVVTLAFMAGVGYGLGALAVVTWFVAFALVSLEVNP